MTRTPLESTPKGSSNHATSALKNGQMNGQAITVKLPDASPEQTESLSAQATSQSKPITKPDRQPLPPTWGEVISGTGNALTAKPGAKKTSPKHSRGQRQSTSTAPLSVQAAPLRPTAYRGVSTGTQVSWWGKLSVRAKAASLAVVLATVPVVTIGAATYYFVSRTMLDQVYKNKQQNATQLGDQTNAFLTDRFSDIKLLSQSPILRNTNLFDAISQEQKEALLDRYIDIYKVYNSLAVFDLKGEALVQSKGAKVPNHATRDYFMRVLKTGEPTVNSPSVSRTTKTISFHFAAPIKDSETGKLTGVARAQFPVASLDKVLTEKLAQTNPDSGDRYYLIDSNGKYFLAAGDEDRLGKVAKDHFAKYAQLQADKKTQSVLDVDPDTKSQQLLTYVPLKDTSGLGGFTFGVLIASDASNAFAPQRQLLLTILIGTGATAVLVGIIAAIIASRATRPILAAADAVKKIGEGELDTRLDVYGEDEIASLGTNINKMADQLGVSIQSQEAITEQTYRLAEEQRQLKEGMQRRALELLQEVDPISKGDLTTRARVTADEIGTIADSYNLTVNSLRKIVMQVQAATSQVVTTTEVSETSVQTLAEEALRQAEDVAIALQQIEHMAATAQAVAVSAEQAEAAVQQSTQTVQEGDAAMNRTVDGMRSIRATVAETTKKVKHLGESSQKISTVVELISAFAAQTNILALNASIEASRAGEEGRGFAVVAQEVRELAQRSAEATGEIRKLIVGIQAETNEVVATMEAGTEQVVVGTKLVDETRQSLNKITAASAQISGLVESIAQATVLQSQASEVVTKTMKDVAAIANKTSTEANQVSSSFEELRQVAQSLQVSVDQFKVS